MRNAHTDPSPKTSWHFLITLAAALGYAFAASTPAMAQNATYPAKSVRIIVPFPAGGGADSITRVTAQKLSDAMGQQFIVESRAGASGNIGSEFVARSSPDGYTLLSSSSTMITAAALAKVPFDVVRDFVHISTIATSCLLIAAHPSVPATTMKELVNIARRKPGEISYASSGSGTSAHMLGELLRQTADVNMLHVPYKGSAPIMTALLSGEVAIAMPNLAAAAPFAKSGRLKILAITCSRRDSSIPNTPTIAEAGYPEVEYLTWWGLSAPTGTPSNIVARLNQEITKIVQLPEVVKNLANQGAEARGTPVDEFNNYVRSESLRWQKVVKLGSFDKN